MTRIIALGEVKERYQRWSYSILGRLGLKVTLHNQAEFTLRKQIHTVILADEPSFLALHSLSEWSNRGKLVHADEYGLMKSFDENDLIGYYKRKPDSRLGIGPAFWSYLYGKATLPDGTTVPPFETFIAINVDAVKMVASSLVNALPEVPERSIEQSFFNVACLHEAGHHYMFGNFLPDQMIAVRSVIDLNLAEGYASVFAHGLSTQHERYMLAEYCLRQPAPYRFYHALRPYMLTELFRSFIDKTDYFSGLREFIGIANVRILFSSGGLYSDTFIDGAPLMDLSDQGGVVMAGQRIERIVPLPSGYIIAPVIEHLLGRCPPTTRIYANAIHNHEDYGILPPNVTVIPLDVLNLERVIGDHLKVEAEKRLEPVLQAIASAGFSIC